MLFNMFGKVKDENNLNPDGIGLGLFICKSIAEAMGGRIGFSSEAKVGSSFWLEVPLEQHWSRRNSTDENQPSLIPMSSSLNLLGQINL